MYLTVRVSDSRVMALLEKYTTNFALCKEFFEKYFFGTALD